MQTARSVLIFTISFMASGCNANFPAAPSAAAVVTSLVILYPTVGTRATASSGGLVAFEAYTIDSDGVHARVTQQAAWSSSDSRFIQPSGLASLPNQFTFQQAGNAAVIARYQGMVAVLPTDVRPALSRTSALEINSVGTNSSQTRTVTLWTNGSSRDVSASVTWSSSDERIATMGERGQVTAGAPGNVRITATRDGLSDYYWMSVPPRSR